MILTRRKTPSKTLRDGIWNVAIQSVHETIVNGKNVVIFNLHNESGNIRITLPVNESFITDFLPQLMHITGIYEWNNLGCFVDKHIKVEIINHKVKRIIK